MPAAVFTPHEPLEANSSRVLRDSLWFGAIDQDASLWPLAPGWKELGSFVRGPNSPTKSIKELLRNFRHLRLVVAGTQEEPDQFDYTEVGFELRSETE